MRGCWSRGRAPQAAAIAGEVGALTQRARTAAAPGLALRLEAAGLAALYQGHLDAADRGFAGLETIAQADGDDAITARALALRGMVAQQRGELALAAELHGKAGDAARKAGEVHAAAVADVNRGTALAERGRFGEAAVLAAAARTGAAYVVFGQLSPPDSHLDLDTLTAQEGWRIVGDTAHLAIGADVASAGDFNGDGFDDIVLSGYTLPVDGVQKGVAWIVFGHADGASPSARSERTGRRERLSHGRLQSMMVRSSKSVALAMLTVTAMTTSWSAHPSPTRREGTSVMSGRLTSCSARPVALQRASISIHSMAVTAYDSIPPAIEVRPVTRSTRPAMSTATVMRILQSAPFATVATWCSDEISPGRSAGKVGMATTICSAAVTQTAS